MGCLMTGQNRCQRRCDRRIRAPIVPQSAANAAGASPASAVRGFCVAGRAVSWAIVIGYEQGRSKTHHVSMSGRSLLDDLGQHTVRRGTLCQHRASIVMCDPCRSFRNTVRPAARQVLAVRQVRRPGASVTENLVAEGPTEAFADAFDDIVADVVVARTGLSLAPRPA